ncbi:MAG TPA: hypothetical protein VNW68_03935 [Candidatus Limnocylindria bacterium]|nr:hypothetical protein [Candidatus Limnocylindria bacterium]
MSRVLIFETASEEWRHGPPLPEPIHHSALVSTGDALYLIGGYRGSRFGTPVADVRRLDPTGEGWVDAVPLPEPRAAGAAAWDGRRIVYAGGVGPAGVSATIFALDGGEWSGIGELSSAREHFAAASDDAGTVWFLGGRVGGLAGNVGTVDALRGGSLEPLGERLTPRSGVAAFWTPASGACLAGGEGPAGTFDEVECIAGDGQLLTLPPLALARHGLAAAVVDGDVIIALGGPRPGLFVSSATERLTVER